MRIDTSSCDFDLGEIRINPTIQDRINWMHRQRAEEKAERNERIAIESRKALNRMASENEMLKAALRDMTARWVEAIGWPSRAMLPAPESLA